MDNLVELKNTTCIFETNTCCVEDLKVISQEILEATHSNTVFAFYGCMGSGKTTLIKEMCRQLGSISSLGSPTFSILNEYARSNGKPMYHFDFYRINRIEEVYDLGYEDYFFGTDYCFIEWPEKIENLLNFNHIKIQISPIEDCREIKVLQYEHA